MVNTRKTQKKAEQESKSGIMPSTSRIVAQSEVKSESVYMDTRSAAVAVEKTVAASTSRQSRQGSEPMPSTSSSLRARRKKLELEAAQAKARIEMELIDKRLAADIADLEDEYSPLSEKNSIEKVEKWLERSQHELDEQRTHDKGQSKGAQRPLVNDNTGTDGTVQMLASALRDLAASSSNQQNANLLSRLSTPRDLPVFSGNHMEWLQFKQAYEESTEVCNFTSKENLWRLRKCLQGAAKEAVSALLISAAAPDVIMSTLELQFGNPDIILSCILADLKKLQPMSHEYHKEIVPFSVKVKNFVAAVRAVGRHEYLQGMHIVSTILSKLPTVLISKWADHCYSHTAVDTITKMEILSEFLTNEAIKISSCNVSLLNTRPHVNKRQNEFSVLHTEEVFVQSQDGVQSDCDKCRYCRISKHSLPDCKRFKKALRKDKWRYVKENGICFKCLKSRHNRETCPAAACDRDDCGLDHHRLLHYPVSTENIRAVNSLADARAVETPSSSETVNHVSANDCKVLLKVVPINIHGPNGVFSTTALLDDGSTVSLISADLAERVGLRGRRETMHVCGPWSGDRLECSVTIVKLNVSNREGNMFCLNARSVKQLSLPEQNLSVINCQSFKHLNVIKNKFCCNIEKPEILIGQDNYDLLLPQEIVVGKHNEPCATLTALGWCVHGRVPVPGPVSQNHSALCLASSNDNAHIWNRIHEEVRQSFSIESMGVSAKPRENSEDRAAVARLEQTATLIDGRWYVGLPWKDTNCKMPDSYSNALSRLKGVEKKIKGDMEYGQRYVDRINHLFDNDYAETIKRNAVTQKTWYLPHFGVDNPNKKKLRLVFDAAAQVHGMSLNDYLHKGPDLLMSLLGIMLRFRENRIAITGDIKDMFLRIKILIEDRNAFRFLWRDDESVPVSEYQMSSLIFGANCSPFIAQFIKNKNAERFSSSMPSAASAIRTQHYMDDYIDSVPDEETAIQLVRDISYIHKQGGFQMCNWASNSEAVLSSIPKDTLGHTADAVSFKVDQLQEGERTLGLLWFPTVDTLSFDVSFKRIPNYLTNGDRKPTKRQMLCVLMSIFDVFGFLAPFTINGRIMLQDTWRLNIGWDDHISDEIFVKWRKWLGILNHVREMRIPRFYQSAAVMCAKETTTGVKLDDPTHTYSRNESNNRDYTYLQLHIFCDASPKAMCAVAYWRWVSENRVCIAFISSKCRVAPVKATSVPRLELQAALLAARLADTIKREHTMQPMQRYFWSDSTTVLHWIRNDTRNYKAFVAHRLGEIDELTQISEWRYVPTKFNIADLATRETYDASVLDLNGEWLNGPIFLYGLDTTWPNKSFSPEVDKCNLEFISTIQLKQENLPIPDCIRFSSWLRLQKAMTAVLTFINKCRRIACEPVTLMERAEQLLIKQAQSESFPEETAAIRAGQNIGSTSRLLTLSPFFDEHGILRAYGRIDAAPGIDLEVKRPIILDGRHPLSRLIVRHHHVKAAHGNQETVVNELKQKYWIIKIRPTVKHIASTCMFCRIRKAKPQIPRMGDLPAARMAHHVRPFTYCGVDLFGPYEVTVGRRREKRYGVLFTCLTVRAIHIELVHTLTTDSLILAVRRMAARRGWPTHMYSDNGTNLRGADIELRKSIQDLDQDILKDVAANYTTCWTFIPPASPHWGGAWERLIRSVKATLKVVLKERAPKEEAFLTLIAEAEGIVNSRPLTHVSVEPGSEEALTPNHFLLGTSSNVPVMGAFSDSDLCLRRQWRISQRLADMFWKRWVKEVLPEMIPRQKWQTDSRPIRVGDLVVIVDPDGPRNVWPRGLVQQVFPGNDGRIRMIEVKTGSGTLKRSVARVALIPVGEECR